MTATAPKPAPAADQPADRHDPLQRRDYLSIEHVERYRFALSVLRPGRVLDVASGCGYGTAMLAARGFEAVGVDVDAPSVAAARRRHRHGRFVAADGLRLPFADDSFDAVVSFETLEHVTDGKAFLEELRRVLRPGGTLVCSTPNLLFTAHPPGHLVEYRPEGFFALVDRVFGASVRYGQYFRRRDRWRDLYHWHVRGPLVRVVDRLGLRPWVRPLVRMVRGVRRRGGRPAAATGKAGDPVRALLEGAGDPVHAVRAVTGGPRLRIMVAVARAEEGT